MGRRSTGGPRGRHRNTPPDMWLGRCACGRDIVVPTAVFEAIVRVRALLRAQRLGPRPLRDRHWAYGVIGLMAGIFVGLVIGLGTGRAEPGPLYLGDFVMAKDFNAVAADLGCPQVDAIDGELLRDAMRRLNRCFRDRDARGDSQ